MPTGPGRFRVKSTSRGTKVRLHFTPEGTVNEVKNLRTGKSATPENFAATRKRRIDDFERKYGDAKV